MDANIPGDTVTDIDVLKKMEDEHLRLQRQVRTIQADRNNSTMGVHPQFRRSDHLLKVLKSEYLDLAHDLKLASTGAHRKKDKRMKIELRRALLLRNKTEHNHEAGITLMDQLDELLHRNSKQALLYKKLVNANVGQMKERRAQSEKRLVSTENRLETAKLRFNVVQNDNKMIREEIEHMLKDRALFNQAWGKMISMLCKGKKFLQDLFESSTVAYDLRDEWCSKLRTIQEKGKVDQMMQVQEMRDLQKAMDHEIKLFNFLSKKGVKRVNKIQEEREEMLKKKEEDAHKKELEAHNKLLDDISEYAEEEKIAKIIESFQHMEQGNFSVYELLTEYCAENVMLHRGLLNLRQVIVDRHDWNESEEAKRQDRLSNLQHQLEVQRWKNSVLKHKVEEKEESIVRALDKIAELFKMLNCSLEPYLNLLGDKTPSSRWQTSLTLTLITDKIKEYLEVVYYTERVLQKSVKVEKKLFGSRLKTYVVYPNLPTTWSPTPLNLLVPADPCPACVESRWLSRVSEIPEEPFTSEQTQLALQELVNDPAYLRSDRVHPLTDCRVPSSRLLLAARYYIQ